LKEHIKSIRISEYNYELPEERIARYPAEPRHDSRILIYRDGEITADRYLELDQHLPENAVLIFNQTKVIQARLHFEKNERTTIEVFCLEPPAGTDIHAVMQSQSPVTYRCLIGGARKWKSGTLNITTSEGTEVRVEKLEHLGGDFLVRFSWDRPIHFAAMLDEAGVTPLPPYIKREADNRDAERYQTIYAQNEGSVAAPTAGLHFSDELMTRLDKAGVTKDFLTLHVGAGTFKPVTSEQIGDHDMHAEEFFPEIDFLERLREHLGSNIISVGTTSMRALESIYWLGVKLHNGENMEHLHVDQWDPYNHYQLPSPAVAITNLIEFMLKKKVTMIRATTSLIIAPGYVHRICRGLLTNFHQPRSTLLLLVASMVGEDWKSIYKYALDHDFRFLSYGDGSLLLKS
jgi:S-adenosylmethionine:tRNA ribosyltransferase-isomerase